MAASVAVAQTNGGPGRRTGEVVLTRVRRGTRAHQVTVTFPVPVHAAS